MSSGAKKDQLARVGGSASARRLHAEQRNVLENAAELSSRETSSAATSAGSRSRGYLVPRRAATHAPRRSSGSDANSKIVAATRASSDWSSARLSKIPLAPGPSSADRVTAPHRQVKVDIIVCSATYRGSAAKPSGARNARARAENLPAFLRRSSFQRGHFRLGLVVRRASRRATGRHTKTLGRESSGRPVWLLVGGSVAVRVTARRECRKAQDEE
jgi:hypothetical protein